MNRISLVCTIHDEAGPVTVSELHAILERIQPDVIFMEIPPASIDDGFMDSDRANLESRAVIRYQENHKIKIVPVDLPTPDAAFFRNHQLLCERIEKTSYEYCRLIDLNSAHVRRYGFPYLNSEHCSKLWADIDEETLKAISMMNDQRLLDIYQKWRKVIDQRDIGMMDNILQYCMNESFNKGAFLVGASHRNAVIEKAKEQSAKHPDRIQWYF